MYQLQSLEARASVEHPPESEQDRDETLLDVLSEDHEPWVHPVQSWGVGLRFLFSDVVKRTGLS